MVLRKILPLTLRPSTSLMAQTSQFTSETFHLSPPLFSPPSLFAGELPSLVSALAEMFQLFEAGFQSRCDQLMQKQQDFLQCRDLPQKQEDFCLNVVLASQDLAEQVDSVVIDGGCLYPEEAMLEFCIDFLKMTKMVEQGVKVERLSSLEQAFIYQDIQSQEPEQLNCELILGLNVVTIKQTNFTQNYLDLFQLLNATKTDIQIILAERGENFVQLEVTKFCNQILMFHSRNALILTWLRKKPRVRYKYDTKCYWMG